MSRKENMKEQDLLKEKVSLALLTYGAIRKISKTMYMSDSKYGPFNVPVEQTLFNINTGIPYEKVNVTKWELHRGFDDGTGAAYRYYCNVCRSRNNFVYSNPAYRNAADRTGIFTLYSPAGVPIFRLKELKSTYVKYIEYKVGYKYIFIELHYGKGESYGLLYNLLTDKLEEYYPNVIETELDEDLATLSVTRALEDYTTEKKIYTE